WALATTMQKKCVRRPRPRDGTPMREVRVEQLDADGAVRSVSRCAAPLAQFRVRLGTRLVERLDDELDAHVSFLLPRKQPAIAKPEFPSGMKIETPARPSEKNRKNDKQTNPSGDGGMGAPLGGEGR